MSDALESRVNQIIQDLENNLGAAIEDDLRETIPKFIDVAFREVIDTWYASYDRVSYKPKYSLRNVYKIDVTKDNIHIDINSDNISGIKHRLGSDAIYDLVFIRGYHGGARRGVINGESHPNPGTPTYAKFINGEPVGWGRAAARSPKYSPYIGLVHKSRDLAKDVLPKVIVGIVNKNIKSIINKY